MTLLTWNHACTIGIRAMDDQHAILMDTLNDLRLTLVHGGGREQMDEGLGRLLGFTRMHFISEERLLEAHDYPLVIGHREVHRRLLNQLETAAQRSSRHDEIQSRTLLLFLRDWYLGHLEGMDRDYALWLNQRGIL